MSTPSARPRTVQRSKALLFLRQINRVRVLNFHCSLGEKMKFRLLIAGAIALASAGAAFAQTEAPGQNAANANPNPVPSGGQGAVLGSFPVTLPGGTPVGLENFGGNLLITDIGDDSFSSITTTGMLVTGPTVIGGGPNPIGITTDGTNIYVTDTTSDQVLILGLDGTPISSFDVTGITTFPEGVTYSSADGFLYVVDGSGGNQVGQYTTAGVLQATFPINGSSPDGIAWDSLRGVFWIYDSGTDTVRAYDTSFNEVDSFPGTIAAGFAGGEGLAVQGDSVFVVATGSDTVVEFGLAPAEVQIFAAPVDTLSRGALALLALLLVLGTVVFVRRSA